MLLLKSWSLSFLAGAQFALPCNRYLNFMPKSLIDKKQIIWTRARNERTGSGYQIRNTDCQVLSMNLLWNLRDVATPSPRQCSYRTLLKDWAEVTDVLSQILVPFFPVKHRAMPIKKTHESPLYTQSATKGFFQFLGLKPISKIHFQIRPFLEIICLHKWSTEETLRRSDRSA